MTSSTTWAFTADSVDQASAFMSTANILIKALQPWPFDRSDRTTGCSWTICCRTCLRETICPVPVVALGQLCWLLPAKLGSGMGRTVWISTVVGVPFLGQRGINPTPMHLFGIRNPLEDPPKDGSTSEALHRSCSASAETPMSRFNSANSSFPRSLSTWLIPLRQ
jgi:hypothetical protein